MEGKITLPTWLVAVMLIFIIYQLAKITRESFTAKSEAGADQFELAMRDQLMVHS